jgi:tRNA (mo5U34)-methyltransferase
MTRPKPGILTTNPRYPASRTWRWRDFALTLEVPRAIAERIERRSAKSSAGGQFQSQLIFLDELPELHLLKRNIESSVTFWDDPGKRAHREKATEQLNQSELGRKVAALNWYHTIELPGGVVTPGEWDHRPLVPRYGIPDDLSGMRVLDVATFDGFWAFEFERRGADVVAIDIPSFSALDHPYGVRARIEQLGADSVTGDAFRIAAEALGSKVQRVAMNVYDLNPDDLGVFDLVHVGDLLIHVRDPVLALNRIRSVTKGTLMSVDSILLDMAGPTMRHPLQYGGGWDSIVWWRIPIDTLAQMIVDSGFPNISLEGIYKLDTTFGGGSWRAIFKAT